MDKRKIPERAASSLLVHNQSRSDRTDPKGNSFKFRKIKIESPDASVLSDFSEQHDFISRSNFETPSQTPKLKFSLEECSYSLDRDYDGIRGLEKGESRRLNISDIKKLPIASIGELQEEEQAKVGVPSLTDSPMLKPQKASFKKTVTQFFSGQSTKNLVEDAIHKKQTFTDKSARFKANRLLGIIATHAASQKNTDVTKVLKAALIKVNPEALQKAQIDATRKKKKIRKLFRSYAGWKNVIIGPWKPESRFIVYWKVILLFAIMIQAFISTYIIAFFDNVDDYGLNNKFVIIDFVVDIAYIFSILIRLRTAYYHQGELRIKSSDILFNYLKGSFVADILSELSLIGRFAPNANSQYLILMTLFKIFQIKGLISSIEDHFQFSRLSRTVVEVLKLCCAMMLLAHWFACMLYYITRNEPQDDSWLVTANLQRSQTDDIYVAALYWAVATMSTVGYGDITPRTTKERVLVIAIMIFSSIVFGYLLSSIGSLLFELTTFSSESREKIRLVNKYMKEKGLSKDIQSKIRKYLQFFLDKENSIHTEADNILQMLSQTLKDEIIKEVNARVLDDAKIFSSNFRSKFLNIVSREFTEKSFGPDDFVFHHNDVTNLSAYFITAGRVEVLYEKSGVSLQKINKGDNFGLFSFFSGNPRTASAKSIEFTNCFVLSREKFFEKLEEYPSEKEMYMMIKESITLQGSYQYFNISCYSCNSKEHIAIDCPKVHFTTNRKKTISNYLINQRFFRRQFQRKDRPKFKPLSNLEALHEAGIQHQLSQQNELYFDENEDEAVMEVRSYSSIDEILDKNVYDLQPLIYCADATQFRAYAVHEDGSSANSFPNPSSPSLSHLTKKKQRKKQKRANNDRLNPEGEIENFVRLNFDKYYHNLNLDRVKNYEVYNPVNNVNRLVIDLDRSRIMRGVEGRLSGKSKHISKWLIKGFRMNENKTPKTFQSTDQLDKIGTGKKDITERRKSVMPGDIMMYSTKLQKQFGKNGNDSSRSRIGFYDSDHTIRKLSNDTAKKPKKKNKRPAKSKMAATAFLPGTNKDLTYKTKRQVSALTKSKQLETSSSQNSDSSDDDSSSGTHSSNPSETDEAVTPKLNINLSVDPTPSNRNHEEKLLTANFGDVTTKHAFAGRSISPKTPSRTRLPMSPTSNQEIKDIRGRPVITSEQYIGRLEHDENDSKKPVAMFDFTRLLKKMTGKLEENSKSYRKTATTAVATAASHRPQHSQTNKSSTIQSRQSRQPTLKYREDLLVKLLHKKNKNVGSRKKGRASSVEDGREVRKVMDMYGLEEILQGK